MRKNTLVAAVIILLAVGLLAAAGLHARAADETRRAREELSLVRADLAVAELRRLSRERACRPQGLDI
jgi:Tfp pilus assembly protein PilV